MGTGGLSIYVFLGGFRKGQGFQRQERGIDEAGPPGKQELESAQEEELPSPAAGPVRVILTRIGHVGLRTMSNRSGHPDRSHLLSGAALGNASPCCMDNASSGGHLWASGHPSMTIS